MGSRKFERCVVLLIDGISTSKFNLMLNSNLLPNIKELMKNGTYIPTCVSTFPSVTGPAHVPHFTGKNPFYFGIAGHNQFNRNYRYFDNYLIDYASLNRQFRDYKTIYEYYDNSVSVGELIYKGASEFIRYFSGILAWIFRVDVNTKMVLKRMIKEYDAGRDLIFGWLSNSDAFQHICRNDKKLIKHLKRVDNFVGILMKIKDKDTRVIICSDHGMERMKTKFNIKKEFKKMNFLMNKMKFNFDGGAFAQIYFKNPEDNSYLKNKISYKKFRDFVLNSENFMSVMKELAESKSVEFIMIDYLDHTYIYSENSIATIKKHGNKYFYSVMVGDEDPFLYLKDKIAKKIVDKWITKEESLKYSHHTKYPDAIYQVHGLLQLRNAGEIVVTSAKNVTWNFLTPYAAHGGIRRDQMVVPFILSDKIDGLPMYMRTEEIFEYIIGRK